MTYDDWKTPEPDDGTWSAFREVLTRAETELQALYADHEKLLCEHLRLRASRDALLTTAKWVVAGTNPDLAMNALRAAIAKAEEPTP